MCIRDRFSPGCLWAGLEVGRICDGVLATAARGGARLQDLDASIGGVGLREGVLLHPASGRAA
eukprot:10988103-Alexandrium_andersonii.AAC.1